MKITVAICTWNRAPLLDTTLASMGRLRVPDGVEWELLVVNNNCTDDTDAVIARHAKALPLRRLFEANQGHSNARNCAVRAAEGELVVWTDDDVRVDPDWLAAYVAAAGRWPQAAYFGGLIAPWYEQQPPSWITANFKLFETFMVIRDFGEKEKPFTPSEEPFGANLAFRRWVFDQWRFDPRLGRQGNGLIGGDETSLLQKLRSAGHHGIWVPAARIEHYVTCRRMSRENIWDYFCGKGRTQLRINGAPEGARFWGAPRWLYRQYLRNRWLSIWYQLLGRANWVVPFTEAARLRGMILESRQAYRPTSA